VHITDVVAEGGWGGGAGANTDDSKKARASYNKIPHASERVIATLHKYPLFKMRSTLTKPWIASGLSLVLYHNV
jgi:hypothetical protein